MNPSASGWVKKFGHIIEKQAQLVKDKTALFIELKYWGFLYGASIDIPDFIVPEHQSSLDEKNKINLLYGLYVVYSNKHSKGNFEHFTELLLVFYEGINSLKSSQFKSFLGKQNSFELTEKIIDTRVFMPASIFEKTMGKIKTNPFVFLDILSFSRFLKDVEHPKSELLLLENLAFEITQLSLLTFTASEKKTEEAVLKGDFQDNTIKELTHPLELIEKKYYAIIGCMNSLEALTNEPQHDLLIKELSQKIDLELEIAKQEVSDLRIFITRHKKTIPAFRDAHIGEQIYDNLGMLVNKLILRNSKRLLKELKGSQELLVLLSKSTHKELSELEKKKIQEQSLDIIKAIPSLAIFLLPGGAILLPIFIKLIPKLLPAAFDDNRI
ncbi:MAG: LETM1-related biofilm-associated protein [Flavobacteriia bacterium]|nr:LETM1-related biofilm-associated protein [Flavobacteriia bacterium]